MTAEVKPATGANEPTNNKSLLPPAAALLRELLESSRNLPNSSTDLGTIQLGLNEIKDRAGKLRASDKDESSNDTKAHYLLAGSGVNAEDIATDLQSINFSQHLEPASGFVGTTHDVDIDNYLRAKKEENILNSIEESVANTARNFDNFLAQNVIINWRQRKQQICQHFGLAVQQDDTTQQSKSEQALDTTRGRTWGKYSLGRCVLGPISGDSGFTDVDSSQQHSKAAEPRTDASDINNQSRSKKHAKVVTELNQARLQKKSFAIAHAFAKVTESYGNDTRSQQLHDAWNIVKKVSGEQEKVPIKERKYAKVYCCEDGLNSKSAGELRNQVVNGARTYLESQFYAMVETEISKNPQEAQLGGVPSVYNKIKAFVNLKFAKRGEWLKENLEVVNNVPIWALLYYMIRSGHMKEALDFTLQTEKSFHKIERSFPSYLKAYVSSQDRKLPRELQERLHTEFNQRIRFLDDHSDPYKYALYKLIGRCELSRKAFPEVVTTAEDWLWVHLTLTRESEASTPVHERYTLMDLQRMILQFGAKHFNPSGNNPGMYFQVLLLSGLFEWAVHYLYSFSQLDAVHFAIALTYYGFLRPIDDIEKAGSELMLMDQQTEIPGLNFARLIGYYTREFRRADPNDAVDYLVLICLNSDLSRSHLSACHEALKELVLETREFSRLLGDVRADGTRQAGAIEQRMELIQLTDEKDYLHAITEQAAIKADEDGRTADAILLYQLSEEYDTVVSIINKSLGEALSVVELGYPMSTLPDGVPLMLSATEDPAQLARNMMQVYSSNPAILSKVSQRSRETCNALLKIVNARDAFASQQWDVCLQETEESGILSLSPQADVGQVRRRAQQFVSLHESVARNLPTILIMVMHCCVNISSMLSESEYSNAGRATKIADLQARARNCMIYAGMIQYRMPREVYSKLTNLEVMV